MVRVQMENNDFCLYLFLLLFIIRKLKHVKNLQWQPHVNSTVIPKAFCSHTDCQWLLNFLAPAALGDSCFLSVIKGQEKITLSFPLCCWTKCYVSWLLKLNHFEFTLFLHLIHLLSHRSMNSHHRKEPQYQVFNFAVLVRQSLMEVFWYTVFHDSLKL